MKSLKKKRRIQVIILAVVFLVLAVSLIGYGFRDGINFFRSPSEVVAETPAEDVVFRIGGLVKEGTIEKLETGGIRFVITDGGGDVPVVFVGVLPDLFSEGQGAVATGSMLAGVFEASEILAKHDETYMPKEVIDALKEQGTYVEPTN